MYAKFPHHTVGQVIFHIGVVLNDVVQAEFVQTVIRLSALVVVKLNFHTVTVAVHGTDRGQGRVSLCAKAHVFIVFVVNDHGAGGVFLIFARIQKAVPVIYDNGEAVNF